MDDLKLQVFCKRNNYIHKNCGILDAESSPFQINFHLLLSSLESCVEDPDRLKTELIAELCVLAVCKSVVQVGMLEKISDNILKI